MNDARSFANAKIANDNLLPVNLYDIGALSHYELAKLLTSGDSLRASILSDMKKLLDNGVTTSQDDPFGLGLTYGSEDCDTIPC